MSRPLIEQMAVAYATQIEKLQAEVARLQALKTPASSRLLNITKAMLDNAEEECATLRAALEPFARNVDAPSLSKALGHIEREHLWAARKALGNER